MNKVIHEPRWQDAYSSYLHSLTLIIPNGYRESLSSHFITKRVNNESVSLVQKLPTYRAFLRKYIRGEFELYLGSKILYTHDFFESHFHTLCIHKSQSMHTQSRFSDQSIYVAGFSHIRSIHFFVTYILNGGVTNLCCCTKLLEIHIS